MSQINNRHALNQLIEYYQALDELNHAFADININNTKSANYKNLVTQLVEIREFLISQSFDTINVIYRPLANSFICRDHYVLLEATIQFYKQNENELYPTTEPKRVELDSNNDINNDNETNAAPLTLPSNNHDTFDANAVLLESSNDIQAKLTAVEAKLTQILTQNDTNSQNETEITTRTEMLSDIARIKELLEKISSHEFNQSALKSTQDTLAAIHTNFELMKADLSKYDVLLTDHINKSSATTLNAMEKEHARFVLEASAEINAIVRGIREANAPDFAVQNDLMQKNAKVYDDKSFKYFCFFFIMSIFAIFSSAILTSHWVAGKVLDNAKVLKISTVCSSAPVASQKHRLRNN